MSESIYAKGYKAGLAGLDEPTMPVDTHEMHLKWHRDGWAAGHLQYLKNSHNHLAGLVNYLLGNYDDNQWDSSTREALEDANTHLGGPPIEWIIDEDEG